MRLTEQLIALSGNPSDGPKFSGTGDYEIQPPSCISNLDWGKARKGG
jgi:hypothetical protein